MAIMIDTVGLDSLSGYKKTVLIEELDKFSVYH